MKLKHKLISAVLSAVLLASSVSAPNTPIGITALAATSTKLAAPTGVKTTKTSSSVKLSWEAVSGAGGYRVYIYNASTKKYEKYKDITGTTCTINGLEVSTTYKFKVASLKFSTKSPSKTLSKKTSSTDSSIKLTWSAVNGVDGYRVYKYNSATKKYVKYKDVLTTSCTVTGLKASTTYKFKITPLKFTAQNTTGVISAKTSTSPDNNEQSEVTSVTICGKTYEVAKTKELRFYSGSLTEKDLTEILKLTNLTTLTISNVNLTFTENFLAELGKLKNLTELEICNVGITFTEKDLTEIGKLKNLTLLSLSGDKISDVTPLSGLTNLKNLRLYDNSITDITPLSTLTNLEVLSLSKNPFSDISSITTLSKLRLLYIEEVKLTDIKPIAELKSLREVYSYGCGWTEADKEYLRNSIPDLSFGAY